ncbi:MAG: DJ-1/PfpI family protein [Pyrodictiaceae archaeon]
MAKRALFIIEDGFDDFEFFYAYHRLLELGFEAIIASSEKYSGLLVYDPQKGYRRARREVEGKHGSKVAVDVTYLEALGNTGSYDVLVLPGGRGSERARRHREAVELVRRMVVEEEKPVVAICHGPQLLISAGAIKGRRVTAYWGIRDDIINAGGVYVDKDYARDNNIVTIRHTTSIGKGFRLFVELLKERGLVPKDEC